MKSSRGSRILKTMQIFARKSPKTPTLFLEHIFVVLRPCLAMRFLTDSSILSPETVFASPFYLDGHFPQKY